MNEAEQKILEALPVETISGIDGNILCTVLKISARDCAAALNSLKKQGLIRKAAILTGWVRCGDVV